MGKIRLIPWNVAALAVMFLYFVWPTPWVYRTTLFPTFYDGKPSLPHAEESRVNRVTGETQYDTPDGWRNMDPETQ